MRKLLLFSFVTICLMFVGLEIVSASEAFNYDEEVLYYLYSETCLACHDVNEYLDSYQGEMRVDIEKIVKKDNREYSTYLKDQVGVSEEIVPMFLYRGDYWIGFNESIKKELDMILRGEHDGNKETEFYIGRVNIVEESIFIFTLLIGLVDGFNPCSLWALMFLMTMILRFNSRIKMGIVGFSYIITVALLYGLFIGGMFFVVDNIITHTWLRIAVFILAFSIGVINLKEGVGKKGRVSFSIKNDHKKSFLNLIRARLYHVESYLGLFIISVLIGIFASLIELPCTAGFPIIWNSVLSEHGIGGLPYLSYLLLYLLMYLAVEIGILLLMLRYMRNIIMNKKYGERLKFVSGLLMIYLGILLLMGYEVMNNFTYLVGGTILVLIAGIITHVIYYKRNK